MLKLVSHELKAPLNGLAGYTRTERSTPSMVGLRVGVKHQGVTSLNRDMETLICGKMNILLRYL